MFNHYFEIVSDRPGTVKIKPRQLSAVRFPVNTARAMASHIQKVCDVLDRADRNVMAAVHTEIDGGGI